jgi:GntR family transcriptional regulator, transcriptional repressor for pyruvate dehydrogenase complex
VPLSDRVVAAVLDGVRSGRLSPGGRLPTERELGGQFGVSRSVIRDALRLLEACGVLRVEHGRGIFVADPVGRRLGNQLLGPLLAPGEIAHLCELRRALEVAAVGLAAVHGTKEERQRILADAEAATAIAAADLEAIDRAERTFHMALTVATRNPVFTQVTANLLDLLATSWRSTLRLPGLPQASMRQHVRIARRVAGGDPDSARAAMAWHLLSVEESLSGPCAAIGGPGAC